MFLESLHTEGSEHKPQFERSESAAQSDLPVLLGGGGGGEEEGASRDVCVWGGRGGGRGERRSGRRSKKE